MTTPSGAPPRRRKKGTSSKTSKKKVVIANETKQALDLRLMGKTVRQIAEELKCSPAKAHRLLEAGIAEIPQESGRLLTQAIVDRENALIIAHWDKRHEPDHAKVIAASHRNLMALLGLEAPKQVLQVSQDVTGSSPAEAQRIMRELFAGGVGPPAEGKDEPKDPAPSTH